MLPRIAPSTSTSEGIRAMWNNSVSQKDLLCSPFSTKLSKLKSTQLSLHSEELFENTARMRSSQAIGYITPSSRENFDLPGIWTAIVPEATSIITWVPNIHLDHNHCLKLLPTPIQLNVIMETQTPPQSWCTPPHSPPKQEN